METNDKPDAPATAPTAPQIAPDDTREQPALLSFSDFQRVDLRVAQILEAERIEKSEKLIKLQVSLGDELGARQIVAGIAKRYTPDELVGRKIAVVANLKPAKLMGHESRGMLLAASDDAGNLELLSVPEIMPPGAVIR